MSKTDQIKQLIEFWESFRFRPKTGSRVLQIYEEHLKKIIGREDPNVLILGVTPELRMLALRYGCRVTAADINMIVINAMSEFMDYTGLDRNKEIILKCDWLKMPLERHSYDLVLGDGSLNELTNLEDYETQLIKLRSLLKPQSYFSTRISILPNDWAPMAILDILDDYKKRSNKETVSEGFSFDLMVRVMLSVESYNEKTSQLSWKKLIEEMRRLDDQGKILEGEFKSLLEYLCSIPKLWIEWTRTIPRKQTLEGLLKRYFTIVSGSDDENDPVPLYLLKSK